MPIRMLYVIQRKACPPLHGICVEIRESELHRISPTDLTVDVLIRTRDVAAAEPDCYAVALDDHGGIADHFRIPRLVARDNRRKLFPAHAIARPRQAQPPHFAAIAAGVEHPVISVRSPHRRLAQSVLVERAVARPVRESDCERSLYQRDDRRPTSRRPAAACARDPCPR